MRAIAAGLPRAFDAVVLAVLHIGAHKSVLPEMLALAGPLPARHALSGELLLPGRIYVAPPDHHLLIEGARARLVRGPKENFARPAIDPLFRSAAVARGARVVAVVLTGHLDDGSAGLHAVRQCGGVTIVEDPDTAFAPEMPRNAMLASPPDYVLPLAEIAPRLTELVGTAAGPSGSVPEAVQVEHDTAMGPCTVDSVERISRPSALTCPACGGTLWQVRDTMPPRFRCHAGHAFGLATLTRATNGALERTLFKVLRALQEQQGLYTSIAAYHMHVGEAGESRRYTEAAGRAAASAERIEAWLREN